MVILIPHAKWNAKRERESKYTLERRQRNANWQWKKSLGDGTRGAQWREEEMRSHRPDSSALSRPEKHLLHCTDKPQNYESREGRGNKAATEIVIWKIDFFETQHYLDSLLN